MQELVLTLQIKTLYAILYLTMASSIEFPFYGCKDPKVPVPFQNTVILGGEL
jgi:hypothetical protein